jgi:hypothetical protein
MTNYIARFYTDAEYATAAVEAETPEKALAMAQAIIDDNFDTLTFKGYDDYFEVNEIAIHSENFYGALAVWYSDDLLVRHAAPDLLSAARLVIARWESGDLAEAVRELSAAVAKAEGGTT